MWCRRVPKMVRMAGIKCFHIKELWRGIDDAERRGDGKGWCVIKIYAIKIFSL